MVPYQYGSTNMVVPYQYGITLPIWYYLTNMLLL